MCWRRSRCPTLRNPAGSGLRQACARGRPGKSGGMERRLTSKYAGKVNAPEFPPGLDWLNTKSPLSMAALRGKVVILDFWTYC